MPLPALAIAGLASGGAGALSNIFGSIFGGSQANKAAREALAKIPQHVNQAGLAQTLLNSRAPGAAQAERNIYQQEANQIANAQRAATSGNQLLLAGANATGMANQAFNQLGQGETADYQRRYQNLIGAQTADEQAAWQQMQARLGLKGAMAQNTANMFGTAGNALTGFGTALIKGATPTG